MRNFLRSLFIFLFFIFLVTVERVVGLPIFSLLFVTIQVSSLPDSAKLFGLLICSFIIGVVYVVPFWLLMLMLTLLILLFDFSQQILEKQRIMIFSGILGANLILAIALRYPFNPLTLSYHLVAVGVLYALISFLLYQHKSRQILSLSKRVKLKSY